MEASLYAPKNEGVSDEQIRELLVELAAEKTVRKVLLIPPDITRLNSYAGPITCMLYEIFAKHGVRVDVLPALGSHQPMNTRELDVMYPSIPKECVINHNWRRDTYRLGDIPQKVVERISEGCYSGAIPVELNHHLLDGGYDRIFSIGQVVPHEVVGMSNYLKNLFVGCGGSGMINASHYVGALYGMERMMGRDHTPVHQLFDYAREHFIPDLPVTFLLTVNTVSESHVKVRGLFVGETRTVFEKAVELSQKENILFVEKPLTKVVAYLDPFEFKKMWVGNKAIYRTRMAIADGGELIIIAPGINGVGEDPQNDEMIRRYGYCGSVKVKQAVERGEALAGNLSSAAHILHSSSDGRFKITYAAGQMTQKEVESIGFNYMSVEEALNRYPIERFKPGFNTLEREEIYYIPNPAVGLWAYREKFYLNQ